MAPLAALALAGFPYLAHAQQRMRRIGVLFSVSRELPEVVPYYKAWLDGLRELGWIEGQNLVIEYRDAGGVYERLPALAKELVDLKVDLIFCGTSAGTPAARQATSTIPIVVAIHSDPVASGEVASLAHPGGNLTGLVAQQVDILPKTIDLLKQAVPGITKVARLRKEPFATPLSPVIIAASRRVADALGIQLNDIGIRDIQDLEATFAQLKQSGMDSVVLAADTYFWLDIPKFASLALQYGFPMMAAGREFALAGSLMSYSANYADMYRRSARYIDKILRGASPGDLPFEMVERFDFVVNLKTAKALGVTIPEHIMVFATEIIE